MSTFRFKKNNLLLTDIVPSMPQLLDNSKPVQTRTSEPAVSPPYPETAYQWLAGVLDGLINFGKRHGHYGVIRLTKDEYQWLDDVLQDIRQIFDSERLTWLISYQKCYPDCPNFSIYRIVD